MRYHIMANIDTNYSSINEVKKLYNTSTQFRATVPETTAQGENRDIPRIPVAKTLEDCVTAIGVIGRFRRCCSDNEDAKSYEAEGIEAYPVLVLGFDIEDSDIYYPDTTQLPDVNVTHEAWILKDTVPSLAKIMWVIPESIKYSVVSNVGGKSYYFVCDSLRIFDDIPEGRSHPWIDGQGNVLESSELCTIYSGVSHKEMGVQMHKLSFKRAPYSS